MMTELHRVRALALLAAVDDLKAADPKAHFEAGLELCVHAMTHCFNIVVHRSGIRAIGADQIHSDMPSDLSSELTPELSPYLEALREIETMRTLYVRGNHPYSPEVGSRLEEINQLFMPVLA